MLAKRELAPFQFDTKVLNLISGTNNIDEADLNNQLLALKSELNEKLSPTLTNLKDKVVKDDAVSPFILAWQRYEGITESNMFARKSDALRQFSWMKTLGRHVALYDFETSLLEKSGSERVILDLDDYVERQVRVGRDWADDYDIAAPYVVVW